MSTTLFDLWEIPASPGAAAVAFSAAEGSEPLEAVWRMDLSGTSQAADDELAGYLALAQASNAALDDLPERLDSLLAGRKAGIQGLAFNAVAAEHATPEAALLTDLNDILNANRRVSFAAGEEPLASWREAYQTFQETADRLLRAVTHMAWVETRREGRLLGRTRVSWIGDTETFYTAGVSAEHADLHRRSLEVAVVSRNILLRAFATTLTGAAKCSLLLATPGGALLAVPTVWKYIHQILSQVEQYQALKPAQTQHLS